MRELKVVKEKLQEVDGKITKEEIMNAIEDESITIDGKELENSNNLYICLKDK